jgi:hypothetical protein
VSEQQTELPAVDAGIAHVATTTPEAPRKRSTTSDDIAALKKCDDALCALDDPAAQNRIVCWLMAKFGFSPDSGGGPA